MACLPVTGTAKKRRKKMDKRSLILKIAAVFEMIDGILAAIFGAIGLAASGLLAENPDALEGTPVTVPMIAGGSGFLVFMGILSVVIGILAWRASKDPAKAKSVLIAAGVMLAIQVVVQAINIVNGSVSVPGLTNVLFTACVVGAAYSLKEEAVRK